MNVKSGKCAVCEKETATKCSSCNQVFYCSVQHQKQAWKAHKKTCRPFVILSNDKLGRHLVASRDIKPFEVVLKETPIFRGPSQITPPVCLGCLNLIEESDHIECAECGWPMCNLQCQQSPEHTQECQLAKKGGHKVSINYFGEQPHDLYQCVATLRALLLKRRDPDRWAKLTDLESHEDIRRGNAQWKSDQEHIARKIPELFQCEEFSEDEIMKVTGILQVNGHEVPTTDPPHVAVYSVCSFLEHSCLPNLTKSFTKSGGVIVWATEAVKKGSHLSICYSDAVWGTAARQHHLMYTKMFKCECARCQDVTECGTNYSALRCEKPGCDGCLLPANLEEWHENWTCRKCSAVMDKRRVETILECAGGDLEAMPRNDVASCIKYLDQHSKFLHNNHFLLLEVRIQLIQFIGAGVPDSLKNVEDSLLDKKIQLAKETIELLEKLTPSDARILGILCFEMHSALSEKARRTPADNTDESVEFLKLSYEYVNRVVAYLQYEPEILSEGQILKQAKENQEYLKIFMGR